MTLDNDNSLIKSFYFSFSERYFPNTFALTFLSGEADTLTTFRKGSIFYRVSIKLDAFLLSAFAKHPQVALVTHI